MRKLNVSRVYLKIIASFLCMVFFSSMILVGATLWFSHQNERDFYARAQEKMDMISEQLDDTVQSLFDLCDMIMTNTLMTENFKPYSQLTSKNLYYYGSIIKLLRQARLQSESLVDSLFLYADEQRVLYCGGENGMADLHTYFTKMMRYDQYGEEIWRGLLSDTYRHFTVFPPDSYSTPRANDKRMVVPLVYVTRDAGFPRVLVINLSLKKILSMYGGIQFFREDMLAIYDEDGRLLSGAGAPESMQDTDPTQSGIRYGEQVGYVMSVTPRWLNLKVVCFMPEEYFFGSMRYFRIVTLSVITAFTLCGMAVSTLLAKRIHAPIREASDSLRSMQPKGNAPERLDNELEEIKRGIRHLTDERIQNERQTREYSRHYVAQSLTSLLDGKVLMDEQYFVTLLEKDYGFHRHGYRCAVLLIDGDSRSDYALQSEMIDQMQDVICRVFADKAQSVCLHYYRNMLALLLDSDADDETLLREGFDQVSAVSSTSDAFSLRIGVGKRVKYLADISQSFADAQTEVFAIVPEGELSFNEKEKFTYEREKVVAAAQSMDIKRIEEAAGEVLIHAKQSGISYGEAADIVWDIFRTVLDARRRLYPRQASILFKAREDINISEILILSPEINLAPLLSALLHYIPIQDADRMESGDKNAWRMKNFIDEHYDQELSLDILADKVGISAKYLSRIFKQSMGINLTDYLAYVRVEKVKELIALDVPLEQIMKSVGITNRTTFNRTFRKIEGMTPGEYRSALKMKDGMKANPLS